MRETPNHKPQTLQVCANPKRQTLQVLNPKRQTLQVRALDPGSGKELACLEGHSQALRIMHCYLKLTEVPLLL